MQTVLNTHFITLFILFDLLHVAGWGYSYMVTVSAALKAQHPHLPLLSYLESLHCSRKNAGQRQGVEENQRLILTNDEMQSRAAA